MPRTDDRLPPLDELQQRIDEAKSQQDKEKAINQPAGRGGYAKAMNLASALISGSAVGGIGGYYLDRWLESSPLFLIAGFFLGFAAGVYNLMQAAKKEDV